MRANGNPSLTQTLGLISEELSRGNTGYAANLLNDLILTRDRQPKAEYYIQKVYCCVECSEVTEDATDPLWECSNDNCGAKFVSDDRACPECNRPFSRKLAVHGCPECNEGELEEVEVIGRCTHCEHVLELGDVD